MTDAFVSVNGHRVTTLRLMVGNIGPWYAEADFEDAPALSGKVTISLGTLELQGTIVPEQDGTFGDSRHSRIVAGAGGWRKQLSAKAYHNDAGVKARLIAEDAAREAGEVIGNYLPAVERVGNDYVRQAITASTALEDSIGAGVAWWVDYNGLTQVGPRPATPIDAAKYELLSYDPRTRLATLSVDDPAAIAIGSELSERLDSVQTIRDFELLVDGDGMRVTAWMGGSEGEAGRLAAILRGIIRRATDGQAHGLYPYRVMSMAPDGRVNLQAVRRVVGLPDLLPISQWPGVAGMHAELTPGAIVLVQFIAGDRTQPIITHFAGKDGTGFTPVSLVVGGPDGAPAARSGDAVEVLLPPATMNGTYNGAPITGIINFLMPKASGIVSAGSSKVKVAP